MLDVAPMHRWVRKRRWWQTLCATSSSPGRTLQPSSHARHRTFHNFFLWLYNRPKTFYVFLISSLYPYQASNTKQTHPVATDTHVILNCERINNTFCAIFILWGSKFTTLICCKTKYGDDSHVPMPCSDFLIKVSSVNCKMFQCLPTWRWKYHIFLLFSFSG